MDVYGVCVPDFDQFFPRLEYEDEGDQDCKTLLSESCHIFHKSTQVEGHHDHQDQGHPRTNPKPER